mmetsp:Transcript_3653/g.9150  ORF Transcript_3653/g.9150 Transcript_3653/m.9150 type:complete len:219 (+) Transcript_3653:936-1592(+)
MGMEQRLGIVRAVVVVSRTLSLHVLGGWMMMIIDIVIVILRSVIFDRQWFGIGWHCSWIGQHGSSVTDASQHGRYRKGGLMKETQCRHGSRSTVILRFRHPRWQHDKDHGVDSKQVKAIREQGANQTATIDIQPILIKRTRSEGISNHGGLQHLMLLVQFFHNAIAAVDAVTIVDFVVGMAMMRIVAMIAIIVADTAGHSCRRRTSTPIVPGIRYCCG